MAAATTPSPPTLDRNDAPDLGANPMVGLLTEMQALMGLLPINAAVFGAGAASGSALPDEAATEAAFDNMPV